MSDMPVSKLYLSPLGLSAHAVDAIFFLLYRQYESYATFFSRRFKISNTSTNIAIYNKEKTSIYAR